MKSISRLVHRTLTQEAGMSVPGSHSGWGRARKHTEAREPLCHQPGCQAGSPACSARVSVQPATVASGSAGEKRTGGSRAQGRARWGFSQSPALWLLWLSYTWCSASLVPFTPPRRLEEDEAGRRGTRPNWLRLSSSPRHSASASGWTGVRECPPLVSHCLSPADGAAALDSVEQSARTEGR